MDTTTAEQNVPPGSDAAMETDPISNENLTPEEKEQKEKELRDELAKTEEEVNTLKQVLASKQRRVQDIKRLLGIGIVSKLSKDVNEGISRLSETEVMMRANSALKTAGERTSAAFSTVGKKLEDVKNSEFVKSFEEKVGHAYDTVKAKVGAAGKSDAVPGATTEQGLAEEAKPAATN